jgi:DNA (cytosine-5)-methyltransferase 1
MDLSEQPTLKTVSATGYPRFIDLYCGAGFGARGVVSAGGTPIIAVDAWDRATEAYKLNFPSANVLNGYVEELDPYALAKTYSAELLLASPECTSHSIARGSRPACERSRETALHILPWVEAFQPRWVIIENVSRMANWERHSELVSGIRNAGYQIQPVLLNAADLGAPQSRKRLFLVCDREAMPPDQAGIRTFSETAKPTVKDILDPSGTWPDNPLYSPKRATKTLERATRAIETLGENVPFLIVYYGTDRAGGWQSLDIPLRTVTTLDRFALVTWKEGEPRMRMLQSSELVRAMGGVATPHTVAVGSRRDQIKLCGNGICSPVLEAIVRTLTCKQQ